MARHSLARPGLGWPGRSRRKGEIYSAPEDLETTNRYNDGNDCVSKRVHELAFVIVICFVFPLVLGPSSEQRRSRVGRGAGAVNSCNRRPYFSPRRPASGFAGGGAGKGGGGGEGGNVLRGGGRRRRRLVAAVGCVGRKRGRERRRWLALGRPAALGGALAAVGGRPRGPAKAGGGDGRAGPLRGAAARQLVAAALARQGQRTSA